MIQKTVSAIQVHGVPSAGAWAHLGLTLLSGADSALTLPSPGGKGGNIVFPSLLGGEAKGLLVFVRKSEEDLEEAADALSALAPLFPSVQRLASAPAYFGEDERGRIASLERLTAGARIALVLAEVLDSPMPSRREFSSGRFSLRMGGQFPMSQLIQRLAQLGYQRVHFVESPGEFAVRGAVVDFYPLEPLRAVRFLFNENLIESIRVFDPETQAGGGFLEEVTVAPAQVKFTLTLPSPQRGEGEKKLPLLLRGRGQGEGTLRDWLSGPDSLWLVEDGAKIADAPVHSLTIGSLAEGASDYGARPVPKFQGNLNLAIREMRDWAAAGWKVLLYSLNRGEDERVQELLEKRLENGSCQFLIGPLRSGFVHSGLKLAVTTSSELFERSYRSARLWQRFDAGPRRRLRISELKSGDYVVHQQYGIARYSGIRPIESEEHGVADCLLLEYRSSDKLYVPMSDFRLVQKYIGAEGHRPRLASLDTRSWEEVKERVQEGVRETAEKILKLEAERAAHPGNAFPIDSHLEAEFSDAFPYEETPDQKRAIDEVKSDMMSPRPMDRLVVGDVGYGKTEVAMRAAMKCLSGHKQAVVLVPTTILADQHCRTFSKRFAEYPVRVAILSRFQPVREQKEVLVELKSGKIDIVIGTHRLLSPDIAFKDLGLLIIDEEHRFGVKDKERIKALKKDVDVLSLSATPIPRTLYQALSGLRRVSLIQSPPVGRQSVSTWVGPWSSQRVQDAVRAELDRGGQAYYVHNHVRTLAKKVEELKSLLPGVRFGMAHGRMRAEPLEKTMWEFFNRKFDVLVASSIIESGLDIPTVNTLLVEDAQNFGLAQLYQLRGRIGRERQKAYCYLFYPAGAKGLESLPEETRQRLSALREFSELGSGFRLALRDLEIRGAGDLLGAKQHGFINAVGYEFYCELLQEEIVRLQGKAPSAPPPPVHLDIGVTAFIPESYLPGEFERLDFYKKLLAAGPGDLPKLRRELEDLSGPAPEQVVTLFQLMELRAGASKTGIREAARRGEFMEVRFRGDAKVPPKAIERWRELYAGRLSFLRSLEGEGEGVRVRMTDEEPLAWLRVFLKSLSSY